MYGAKQTGKGRYRLYRTEERAAADEGARLRAHLRGASIRDELRLHYQPIVDLRTGQIVALEALVRWEHPERGLLYPASFIPVAEEMGVIVEIGEWVLDRACNQLRWWREIAPALAVSVNLSARQLHSARLVEEVREAVRLAGIAPSSLVLEVTESILADELVPENLANILITEEDFRLGVPQVDHLRRTGERVLPHGG